MGPNGVGIVARTFRNARINDVNARHVFAFTIGKLRKIDFGVGKNDGFGNQFPYMHIGVGSFIVLSVVCHVVCSRVRSDNGGFDAQFSCRRCQEVISDAAGISIDRVSDLIKQSINLCSRRGERQICKSHQDNYHSVCFSRACGRFGCLRQSVFKVLVYCPKLFQVSDLLL